MEYVITQQEIQSSICQYHMKQRHNDNDILFYITYFFNCIQELCISQYWEGKIQVDKCIE